MANFDLKNYGSDSFGTIDKKQGDRNLVVEAALELMKGEYSEIVKKFDLDKNVINTYADKIEEALKVKDE